MVYRRDVETPVAPVTLSEVKQRVRQATGENYVDFGMSSNRCIASSNKCLTSSNKKLVVQGLQFPSQTTLYMHFLQSLDGWIMMDLMQPQIWKKKWRL